MGKKVWLLFALLLLLVVAEIVVFAPVDLFDGPIEAVAPSESKPEGSEPAQMSSADQMMSGVHVVGTKEQGREWELWSEVAEGYKENGLWLLKVVRAHFFAKNGALYKVNGERGKADLESKDLTILGKVVMRSSNGYTFLTNELRYNSAKKFLLGPSKVVVLGPKDPSSGERLRFTGDELEASLEDSYMWIRGGVHTRKVLPDGRIANIRSSSARLSGVNRSVKFNDKVIIDIEGFRVTGPKAMFKYGRAGKDLESVLVEGGAKLSDSDKWATANIVEVSLKEDRIVFKGNPRLVQGGDELRGEKIIFTKGGKRVQVVKARAKVGKKIGM